MRFKYYLLNEEKSHLGHQVSDVLTAVHDLESDLPGMGIRQTARLCQEIVDQLRKILHGQWSPKQAIHLKSVQKVAVALMKAIDEKNDLRELIPSISQELAKISQKMGVRTNDMKAPPTPEGDDISQDQLQLTGMGPTPGMKNAQAGPEDAQEPSQDASIGGATKPPAPASAGF
jgi:hypothetical protein